MIALALLVTCTIPAFALKNINRPGNTGGDSEWSVYETMWGRAAKGANYDLTLDPSYTNDMDWATYAPFHQVGAPNTWDWTYMTGTGLKVDGLGIQSWAKGTGGSTFNLVIEEAGNRGGNEFGIYKLGTTPTFSTTDGSMYAGLASTGWQVDDTWFPIFPGAANAGAKLTLEFKDLPDTWGFYLRNPSVSYVGYSEHSKNYLQRSQERVARHAAADGSGVYYGLFWEDQTTNTGKSWKTTPQPPDPWPTSDVWASYPTSGNWTRGSGIEPDYNDMAVRFKLQGGGYSLGETPELSSGVLLLLGMLPVGMAWRRRRKQ